MSNSAIIKFGEMLTKSKNIFTAGAGAPIFAWAAPAFPESEALAELKRMDKDDAAYVVVQG